MVHILPQFCLSENPEGSPVEKEWERAYKIGANELVVPVISLEDILEDFMPYSIGLVKL